MTRRLDATDLARVAVFAALIAVLGLPGSFPVFGGVPITAQTLGVMLAGAVLGPWLGALSVTVLLALVAVGLPLLAGGRGGFGVFLGPTAGYALGWILGAIVIGLIVHAGGRARSSGAPSSRCSSEASWRSTPSASRCRAWSPASAR